MYVHSPNSQTLRILLRRRSPGYNRGAMYSLFQVRNFRSFLEFRIDGLQRFNLITGQNNAGKTALLEALRRCRQSPRLLEGSSLPLWVRPGPILGHCLRRRGECRGSLSKRKGQPARLAAGLPTPAAPLTPSTDQPRIIDMCVTNRHTRSSSSTMGYATTRQPPGTGTTTTTRGGVAERRGIRHAGGAPRRLFA